MPDETTFAAIDVGSNAIRMAIACREGSGVRMLAKYREAVSLGADVFAHGSIAPETRGSLLSALEHYARIVRGSALTGYRAVGTSALRDAHNGQAIADEVAVRTGLTLEVISGQEEARLVYRAVAQAVSLEGRNAVLIDIGGGSVELSLVIGGLLRSSASLQIGALRLLLAMGPPRGSGRKTPGDAQAIEQQVRQFFAGDAPRLITEAAASELDIVIGTGGNIDTLAALRDASRSPAPLTRDELDALILQITSSPREALQARFRLTSARAEMLLPAALLLRHLMDELHVQALTVPRVGLKDGVLAELAARCV